MNDDINSFTLYKPGNIDRFVTLTDNLANSIDGRYCNATFVIDPTVAADNTPFPYRFKCTVDGSRVYIQRLLKSTKTNDPATTLNGWTMTYPNTIPAPYSIRVYAKVDIALDAPNGGNNYSGGNSGAFAAVGHIYDYANTDTDRAVSYAGSSIYISPIDTPDLNDLTFNTLSFYDRKARIGD